MRPKQTSGNSLARMLNILELFCLARPTIHVEDVVELHGSALSTAYRHLQELCESGLLAQVGKGVYSLGPRVVELERLQQLTDPLLLAGKSALDELEPICVNRALMLCNLYRDRVLCVHHVGAQAIRVGEKEIPVLRGRGMPMPLFKGAGSQAILAWLPHHRLRSLYAANAEAINRAGLGADAAAFRRMLSAIRRRGHALSHGQISPRIEGISVPILVTDRGVIGSLLLMQADDSPAAERESWLAHLHERAEIIARCMDLSAA